MGGAVEEVIDGAGDTGDEAGGGDGASLSPNRLRFHLSLLCKMRVAWSSQGALDPWARAVRFEEEEERRDEEGWQGGSIGRRRPHRISSTSAFSWLAGCYNSGCKNDDTWYFAVPRAKPKRPARSGTQSMVLLFL